MVLMPARRCCFTSSYLRRVFRGSPVATQSCICSKLGTFAGPAETPGVRAAVSRVPSLSDVQQCCTYTRQAAEARHSAMMRANSPPARSNFWGGPASMMQALSITITWSAMPIMAGRWVMTTVV